jgi:hypothetical protein
MKGAPINFLIKHTHVFDFFLKFNEKLQELDKKDLESIFYESFSYSSNLKSIPLEGNQKIEDGLLKHLRNLESFVAWKTENNNAYAIFPVENERYLFVNFFESTSLNIKFPDQYVLTLFKNIENNLSSIYVHSAIVIVNDDKVEKKKSITTKKRKTQNQMTSEIITVKEKQEHDDGQDLVHITSI